MNSPLFEKAVRSLRSSGLWFGLMLIVMCLWVLSLPIFPAQDAPMHRYYVHVLSSLLSHQTTYSVYQVRHPLPPYLTHYVLLLGLFHIFNFDLAEKVFVCLVFCCLAFGLRMNGTQIGPAGSWVTLLFAPLLLTWPVMMGFFNFTLGVALMMWAMAYWQAILKKGWRMLPAFAAALFVLTFTHPIPLLLLIFLLCLDLVLSCAFRPITIDFRQWFTSRRFQFVALFMCCVAVSFPLMAVDSSKTAGTIEHFGFHVPFFRTAILLSGLSPYNSRSLNVSIDLYRLYLYALYVFCMVSGGVVAFRRFRARDVTFGTTIFSATLLLTVALPFLPDNVNGSFFFATRLLFVIWLGALLSGCSIALHQERRRIAFIAMGWVGCACSLLPAQIFIRPAANKIHQAELEPLPANVQGSILLDTNADEYARFHWQLAFDPFEWGGVLPFVSNNDVDLDSPWLDQKIAPLMARPGAPLLDTDLDRVSISKTDPPLVSGRSLPRSFEAEDVRNSRFVVYDGVPSKLDQGLTVQLSNAEAAEFQCRPPHGWYRICIKKSDVATGSQ